MRHTNPFSSRNCNRETPETDVQAAVIDLLTYGDFPPDIDDRGVAESIRTAFSNFVSGQTLNQLDNRTAPFHDSQFYLRVWWSLDSSTTGQSAQTRTVNPALDASELDTAGQVNSLTASHVTTSVSCWQAVVDMLLVAGWRSRTASVYVRTGHADQSCKPHQHP